MENTEWRKWRKDYRKSKSKNTMKHKFKFKLEGNITTTKRTYYWQQSPKDTSIFTGKCEKTQ